MRRDPRHRGERHRLRELGEAEAAIKLRTRTYRTYRARLILRPSRKERPRRRVPARVHRVHDQAPRRERRQRLGEPTKPSREHDAERWSNPFFSVRLRLRAFLRDDELSINDRAFPLFERVRKGVRLDGRALIDSVQRAVQRAHGDVSSRARRRERRPRQRAVCEES